MRVIFINGRSTTIAAPTLSYADLLDLAYEGTPPRGEGTVATVTYHRGRLNASGTLISGQSVRVKSGMMFNVVVADRA